MNLQQFSALEVDSYVHNALTGSTGRVVSRTRDGVEIEWAGNPRTWHFTVASTAWFHWTSAEKPKSPMGGHP